MANGSFTAGENWTVPDGVDQILVNLYGEKGETGAGGYGGEVEAWVSVDAGEVCKLRKSSGGDNTGAYKGGDSAELHIGNEVVLVAGGGGAGSVASTNEQSFAGGDGGSKNGDGVTGSYTSTGGGGQSSPGSGGGSGSAGEAGEDGSCSSGNGGNPATGKSSSADGPGGGGAGYCGGGGGSYYYNDDNKNQEYLAGGGGSNYVGHSRVDGVIRNDKGTQEYLYWYVEYTQDAALPPENVSASGISSSEIEVTWDASPDSQIDNYYLYRSSDGSNFSKIATLGSSARSYTDTGLSSNSTYYYKMKATHGGGTGSYSNEASATTTEPAPSAPSNLSASASSDDISLSWTDNSSVEDGFYIYRGQSSGSLSQIDSVGANTTTYDDTALTDGEKYFYKVSAYNTSGESSKSNEASAVTALPAPDSLSLDGSVEDEISISWSLNDDSSDGSVEVYRSTDGSFGSNIASLSNTATSYTDSGLSDGEKYYYTIRRSTDHVSQDSSQKSAITVLPAPTNLSVSNIGSTSADLSWTGNHDYGDTVVEYKKSSNSSWTSFSTLSNTTESEPLTGLLNGEQYDVRVLAKTEHKTVADT